MRSSLAAGLPCRLALWTALLIGAGPRSSLASDVEAPAEQVRKVHRLGGMRWYVIPNFAFDTDDGVGFGMRGEVALDEPGYTPYRTAYMVHLFFTLRGFHHHRFRFDRTGFGPGGRLRLTTHIAWRQWLNDGYWGMGNGTARERDFVQDFGDGDPRRKRYRYRLFQPFGHATLRIALTRRWQLFTALNAKWSIVENYPGSLLSEQKPYGIDGGLSVSLFGGILYDSRQPEVNPRSGIFAELSGRYAPPLPRHAGSFGGVFASLRGYVSPASFLVLAGRLMGEWLWGEIPFYEMVHWGGAVPIAGFGGSETLRGIAFGRWRAPGKAIANVEARFHVLKHRLFHQPMVWQLALFSDAGVVWGAGDRATAPDLGVPIHPAWGMGLRAIYARSFVGRIDAGFGLDPIREPDGSETYDTTFGFYVVFDHAF